MYSDAAAETQAPIPQTANVTRTAAQETRGGRISLAPYVDWLDILQSPLNPYSDAEEPIPPLNPAPTPRSSALSSRTRQSVRASLIPFRDCVVVFNSRIADRGTEDPREPEPVEPLPAIYSSRLSSVLLPPRAVFPYPSSSYLSTPPPIPPQHPARLLFRSRPSHSTAATMDQNSTSDPFVESNNNHREGLTEIESQAPPSHPESKQLPSSYINCVHCTSLWSETSILSSFSGGPSLVVRLEVTVPFLILLLLVCFESITYHLISIIPYQSRA